MQRPKLPIGIQSFEEIRTGDYLYVDKTEKLANLINSGKYYFLARPRRFGKSVTLSTIKAIYEGRRELFQGLWIESQRDWQQIRPVMHLSFSKLDYQGSGLDTALQQALQFQGELHGVSLTSTTTKNLFSELLYKLSAAKGKVVLLIDEYDKPLIDYLDDPAQARANQQTLKAFYSIIKDSDPQLEFVLLTGVSKFSKVSVFSDLNNLKDLTFDRHFVTLTGYTQQELENHFAPWMPETETYLKLTREMLLAKIRDWYNGYSWDALTTVYNPFSILNFFSAGEFRNFWFETGTPTFLPKLMKAQGLLDVDGMELDELGFSSYDIENLQVLPILLQTGYLTLKEKLDFGLYRLGYPNREVRASMLAYLIAEMRHADAAYSTPMVLQLHRAFQDNEPEKIIALIQSIFKTIPSQIFIRESESYYHSLIYLVFFYLGQYTESEVNTSDGRLDCVVKTPTHIYIIEFKLNKSAEAALKQVRDKGYAEKYRSDVRTKILLGVNFSSDSKTVDDWKSEVL